MYSTESDLTSKQTHKDVNLVEQILEQGQRLRNSMVKAILNNDPTNNKFLQDDLEVRTRSSSDFTSEVTLEEKHKFLAYLRGEPMTRNEEKKVLETFRTMSNVDIIDITDRSLHSDFSCNCDTCREYYKHNQSRVKNNFVKKVPLLNLNEAKIRHKNDKYDYNVDYLKYVDSLKIMVHSVYLNQEGIRKVYGNSCDKNKYQYQLSLNHTYFLEYKIPYLISKIQKTKISKVDSGLDSGNCVRMCSKKVQDETIIFKQISIHDIQHIENVNLQTLEIKFQISSRIYRQKNINVLGSARFNMNVLLENENFTANDDLLIFQNEAPIVIGKLKIGLEFGCGQSYFGENFVRTLNSSREKNRGDNSEIKHVNTEIFSDDEEIFVEKEKFYGVEKEDKIFRGEKKNFKKLPSFIEKKVEIKNVEFEKKDVEKKVVEGKLMEEKKLTQNENVSMINPNNYNNQVLFGFFFVGEACFEEIGSTFVTCNPFCRNDTLYSRIVPQSKTPVYNFQQSLPFLSDESFLNTLRDNFMIFEFWNKSETNENIGIAKVNLHQFYISYRNSVIIKYLERNKLPVIGCDWWEPIYDPLNGEIYGEVQILVALGTEVQIANLKSERGFVNETIRVKTTRNFENKNVLPEVNKKIDKKVNKSIKISNKKVNIIKKKSKDIGIQSDFETNENLKIDPKMENKDSKPEEIKEPENYASIAQFLQTLMTMNNKTFMENCTNTETSTTSLKTTPNVVQESSSSKSIEKASDFLDKLQETFASSKQDVQPSTFKAHIFIENALHLPFRKKSKTKKSRGKSGKYEEILPSCYVTFETINGDVKMTSVVQKNKNPVWNYNGDVELPVELLTNNEKRLIFKVWKRSNGISHPDMDSDMIIGFAGLDLTVLTVGMPNVSGWFNILDFSSKCNGQIKITVTPQENVKGQYNYNKNVQTNLKTISENFAKVEEKTKKIEKLVEIDEEPGELLSRALKRKFTELDEITQRLRLRLSHVTNDESDTSNDDEFADEFEKDINTHCEEDVEMDDFNKLTETFQFNSIDENPSTSRNVDPLDRHLLESRLKLDSLFEKLALLTNNDPTQAFANRHISGCSVSKENNDAESSSGCNTGIEENSFTSEVSVKSCIEMRRAPEGAGNNK